MATRGDARLSVLIVRAMALLADRPQDDGADESFEKVPHAAPDTECRTKVFGTYLLILIIFLTVQFGHGSNIGVAVSLPGNSKAMNLALGSWVMVGVCLGLPLTPWACRTFGAFRVCAVCMLIDVLVIMLMLWPDLTLRQIYAVRFLVGFFEAPLLPYLQEWLSRFGRASWNVWNTLLHAMVPLGENLGYIVAQELDAKGIQWQWAFAGQAIVLLVCLAALVAWAGGRYLLLGPLDDDLSNGDSTPKAHPRDALGVEKDVLPHADDIDGDVEDELEYPSTEKWGVFWATNCSLGAQLGFLAGAKYVIRDYALSHGFSLHFIIFGFASIALIGPALGGGIAMSGKCIRADRWSQHKKTLLFLFTVSSAAAALAVSLLFSPWVFFWPLLLATFISAGGVYPAAQGIINTALTESRVIEASVYQVQCNNLMFAMPLPFAIGKTMDAWGVDAAFHCVVLIQVSAAVGFATSLCVAACSEERSTWYRIQSPRIACESGEEALC